MHFTRKGFSFSQSVPLNTVLSLCVSLYLSLSLNLCMCSSVRAGKERKKPDRVVFDCQERAYWIVNRPPVSTMNKMSQSQTMPTICPEVAYHYLAVLTAH